MSDREYREISAQYAGRCASCGEEIEVGDPILWAPDRPAVHALCTPDPVDAQAAPPAGGDSSATASERETGAERTAREFREKTERRLAGLDATVAAQRQALRRLLQELGLNPDEWCGDP